MMKIKSGFFRKLYKKLLLRTAGNTFVRLFNLRAVLNGKTVRLAWDGRRYRVTDAQTPNLSYVFRHEKQGNLCYEQGLNARAINLGHAYFLPSIEFAEGDVVFDCGANVGDLKLWFDLFEPRINYVGFEPSPIEFSCLKENVEPSEVHNVGLWNEDGELTFYVSSQGADSSLIEPAEYDSKITVATKKPSHFIRSNVKLLKLEAEGAEPEILEGLGESIRYIEYVSADLGYERGKKAESTLIPVVNFMLNKGFFLMAINHQRVCALFRNNNLHEFSQSPSLSEDR